MCIVTGHRIELAITLIDRMKGIFTSDFAGAPANVPKSVSFDTKETVIELNGVHIEAYPSHHLDAMRGLTNVSFMRQILPTWIVMVSTPNAPEGLFERIEKEPT